MAKGVNVRQSEDPGEERDRVTHAPHKSNRTSIPDRLRAHIPIAGLFLAPAFLILIVFFLIPVFGVLVLSLTDFDLYAIADIGNARFIGLDNYVTLFFDPLFWTSIQNTFYFAFVGGPLSVGLSLIAALLIHSRLAVGGRIFQTIYFIPVVTTLVAVAIVWRYLYHSRFGLINYAIGFFGIAPIEWLGDPTWSMPAIILLAVWKNFGLNMLIFLAGLKAIPKPIYDAARIDGAGMWQKFRHITLPLLWPTTLFVAVVTMVGYFQLFTEPYVMTQGGPINSTLSVVLYMYEQGFRWWNIGYASAIAFMLFVIIIIGSTLQLRLRKFRGTI